MFKIFIWLPIWLPSPYIDYSKLLADFGIEDDPLLSENVVDNIKL